MAPHLFIGHDLGTTGDKTVLVDLQGRVLASHVATYPLSHPHPDHAEQDPADWWAAVCEGTRAVTEGVAPTDLAAICFAGQMLALVPMDAGGRPTRPAISWLDHRAEPQAQRIVRRLGGERVVRLLAGGSPTGKDIVAKLAWLQEHEPAVHRDTVGYGDATSYLVARATGRLLLDPTGAGSTGMFDIGGRRWSRLLCSLIGFQAEKMPPICASQDLAGTVTVEAAAMLGVPAGLPVAMGMADIPAAAVGSGAVEPGDAHVYLGTSAWICVSLDRARNIPRAGIASAPSADRTGAIMIAESETAGACRDWFETQVGPLDDDLASQAPPGSDGLLFLPWLFGERSPYPDAHLRGGWIGLDPSHTRAHLARAVLEGVALNLRWTLEAIDRTGVRSRGLRAIGGGTQSDLWVQILADVTGETITRVEHPRLAGAIGAGLMGAVAVGQLPSVAAIKSRIRTEPAVSPSPGAHDRYRSHLAAMQQLAPAVSRAASTLGGRP